MNLSETSLQDPVRDMTHSPEPAVSDDVESDKEPRQRFVTFDIGSGLYGLPAEEVSEISHPLPCTRLPRVSGPITGISPLRGEILAVLDLRQLLNESHSVSSSKTKFVVLRSTPPDCQIALPVDRVRDVVLLDPQSAKEPIPEGSDLIAGIAGNTQKNLNLLDPGQIRAEFTKQID